MAEINEINNQIQGKSKRKRSANWDNVEKNLLRNCMLDYVAIIENKNTDTNTNKCKTVAWEKVTQRFNELNNRERVLLEIKQQWRTIKLEAKKNMSDIKISMNSTGGGPKPPSPSPETLQILSMIPQEFETDSNIFDCDGRGINAQKEQLESPNTISQDIILTTENTDKNLSEVKKSENREKKRKANARSMSNNNGPKYWDNKFAKERNQVLINCIEEEHAIKMKNIVEAHSFTTEEHNLKIKQMLEAHQLLKEETQLRVEKCKLEIDILKSKINLDM